jgi:nitrate/TMAO reductase-like tetraheme cytochrome c subunit
MGRHALVAVIVFVMAQLSAHAQPSTDAYAWSGACKTCHASEWASWEKTKHASAIQRVSGTTDKSCIGCHVTPTGAALLDDRANANVQCEGCHGPGKAHVTAAAGGAAKPGQIVRKPSETICTDCHSSKSPHFKFFSYDAMLRLSHAIPSK